MRLSDCLVSVFAAVRQFQRAPDGDAATLAARLDRLIASARQQAREHGYAEADIETALFAVAAWADESLLALDWNDAREWQRHLLQKRYFNTASAGIAFFTRLEQLDQQQNQVREIYFLCLALGFVGRYGYEGNRHALDELKDRQLYALLQGEDSLSGEAGRLLFPGGYASGQPARPTGGWRRRIPLFTLGALLLPLVVLLALYGAYHTVLWQTANTLLPHIQ